jgi:hypothetical protein
MNGQPRTRCCRCRSDLGRSACWSRTRRRPCLRLCFGVTQCSPAAQQLYLQYRPLVQCCWLRLRVAASARAAQVQKGDDTADAPTTSALAPRTTERRDRSSSATHRARSSNQVELEALLEVRLIRLPSLGSAVDRARRYQAPPYAYSPQPNGLRLRRSGKAGPARGARRSRHPLPPFTVIVRGGNDAGGGDPSAPRGAGARRASADRAAFRL